MTHTITHTLYTILLLALGFLLFRENQEATRDIIIVFLIITTRIMNDQQNHKN